MKPTYEDLAEQLVPIQELTEKLIAGKGNAILTDQEVVRGEKAARAILASITPLNEVGYPVDPIDAVITAKINANEGMIQQAIRTAVSKGTPTPLDYYDIYYQVLQDSGLVNIGLPEPGQFRGMVEKFSLDENPDPFDPTILKASPCPGCSGCLLCGACASCISCVAGLPVASLAATGAVGGAVGAIGYFF